MARRENDQSVSDFHLIKNSHGLGIATLLMAAAAISILMMGLFNMMDYAGRGMNTSEIAISADMHFSAVKRHLESDFVCGCFFNTIAYPGNNNQFDPTPATLAGQSLTMDVLAIPNPDCSENRRLLDVDTVASNTRFNGQTDLTLTSMTINNFVAVSEREAYTADLVLQVTNTAPSNRRGWGSNLITRTIPLTLAVNSPTATTATVTGCNFSTEYLASSQYRLSRPIPTAILVTDVRNGFSSNRQNSIRFRLSDGSMVKTDASTANSHIIGWQQATGRVDATFPGADSWAYLYVVEDQSDVGRPIIVGSGRSPVSGPIVANSSGPVDDGDPGGVTPYPAYKFLGAIRKDSANNIVDFRHEGNAFYWIPTGSAPIFDQTVDLTLPPLNFPADRDVQIGGGGNKDWVPITSSHAIVSLDFINSTLNETGYYGFLMESRSPPLPQTPTWNDNLGSLFAYYDAFNNTTYSTGSVQVPVRQLGSNISVRVLTNRGPAPAASVQEVLRIKGWIDPFVNTD